MSANSFIKVEPSNVLIKPEQMAFVFRICNVTLDKVVYFKVGIGVMQIKSNSVDSILPNTFFGEIQPQQRQRIDVKLKTTEVLSMKICVEYCAVQVGEIVTEDAYKSIKLKKYITVMNVSKPEVSQNMRFSIRTFESLENQLDFNLRGEGAADRSSISGVSRKSQRRSERFLEKDTHPEPQMKPLNFKSDTFIRTVQDSPRKPLNHQYQRKYRSSLINTRNEQTSYNELQKMLSQPPTSDIRHSRQSEEYRQRPGTFVLNFTTFIGSCLAFFILGYMVCWLKENIGLQ